MTENEKRLSEIEPRYRDYLLGKIPLTRSEAESLRKEISFLKYCIGSKGPMRVIF